VSILTEELNASSRRIAHRLADAICLDVTARPMTGSLIEEQAESIVIMRCEAPDTAASTAHEESANRISTARAVEYAVTRACTVEEKSGAFTEGCATPDGS